MPGSDFRCLNSDVKLQPIKSITCCPLAEYINSLHNQSTQSASTKKRLERENHSWIFLEPPHTLAMIVIHSIQVGNNAYSQELLLPTPASF